MWDKYNYFEIKLIGYCRTNVAGGTPLAANSTAQFITLSGLNWIDNCFDIRKKNKSQEAYISTTPIFGTNVNTGSISLTTAANTTVIFNKDKIITDLIVNLKFSINNTVDNYTEKPTSNIGHQTFIFTIKGIK